LEDLLDALGEIRFTWVLSRLELGNCMGQISGERKDDGRCLLARFATAEDIVPSVFQDMPPEVKDELDKALARQRGEREKRCGPGETDLCPPTAEPGPHPEIVTE